MGVVYQVKSDSNPIMYAEDDPNIYLKYAWRDIRWVEIFEILGIDQDWHPHWYYEENPIRDKEEIRRIRDELEVFVAKRGGLDKTHPNEVEELHDDAVRLLEFFNYYVANDAYVVIS